MKSGRVGKHGGRRRREKSRRKRPEVLPKRKIRLVDGCTGNKAAEGLFRRGSKRQIPEEGIQEGRIRKRRTEGLQITETTFGR